MRLSSLFFPSLLESCADARVLAVVFAERADEEQLARGLASVQGFAAHACACVFSPARQERAAATAAAHGASVVRVEGADESSYRTACLLSCLGASPLPASCSRSTYALALEPDAILLLTPGELLPDASHTGVGEALRPAVAAALSLALAARSPAYLLQAREFDSYRSALPLLLRCDVAWWYDASGRSWNGAPAHDAFHSRAFALRLDDPLYFAHLVRFQRNELHFREKLAAMPDHPETVFYLAHTLKDAGRLSDALPLFARHVALASHPQQLHAQPGARDWLFLSHLHSGAAQAVRGNLDEATWSLLAALEAHPSRKVEALTELAEAFRLRGAHRRALLFACAASQAAAVKGPPAGALFPNEAAYHFGAHLEVSLSAFRAGGTPELVLGVRALTRLLSQAAIPRHIWLASFDNAAAYDAELSRRGHLDQHAAAALNAMRAASTPSPATCSTSRVSLDGSQKDDSACGAGSVLGSLFSAVAVIVQEKRVAHVERFLVSIGCTRYFRVDAIMHLTPAELNREHNPRIRGGEMRLLQAHACALHLAATSPQGSKPLAIFEDDVAPMSPLALPAAQHLLRRLVQGAPEEADMLLLGRCPARAEDVTQAADAVVRTTEFACAHAYAVTQEAARYGLHSLVSRLPFSEPLDMMFLHMARAGQLQVYTNAGVAVFAQALLSASLNSAAEKGPPSPLPLLILDGAAPLRVTSFGGWGTPAVTLEELWLLPFILQNVTGRPIEVLPPQAPLHSAHVIFVSVFAPRPEIEEMIRLHGKNAALIFMVGENTHERESPFADQLTQLVDLSLGHRRDRGHVAHFLRFPWWVPTALVRRSGDTSLDAVAFHPALLKPTAPSSWLARPGFAVFVNAHASHPRAHMLNLASQIADVDAPGPALRTMAWPHDIPDDVAGKLELLRRYRFVLCPENSVSPDGGYVTEKLPQAHIAGAVPLYWGDGAADGEVWNPGRMLLYDDSSGNEALLETMLKLEGDQAFRDHWFSQPILAPSAHAWLKDFTATLSRQVRRALASKGLVGDAPDDPDAVEVPQVPRVPRVHLASFCGCSFESRRASFLSEARASGLFHSVRVSTPSDLDPQFSARHAEMLARPRGCGYYLWKPAAALAALSHDGVRTGDVLVYVDAGCSFNGTSAADFDQLVQLALSHPSGLVGLQMDDHLEHDWTKADVFHATGAQHMRHVTHTGQLLGGVWLLRVSTENVALLQRWQDMMSAERYRLLDDSPSEQPNPLSFQEHRHDQSLWSVLRKIAGAAAVPDTSYGNGSAPIRADRCKDAACGSVAGG